MTDNSEGRLSGGLIIAAVLGTLGLMLHHPTAFTGPDDGLLLNDWNNMVVHGAMFACLLVLRFAFSTWARRLGPDHASARAGAMAFDAGMTALIAAALITGFGGPAAVQAFGGLVRALANIGMGLTAAAMALWAVRMLRLDALSRIAGALALIIAAVAVAWGIVGRGAFGLYPATVATVLFGAWSLLVASQMMGGDQRETHDD